MYYATDTLAFFYDNGGAWVLVSGTAQGTLASLPAAGHAGRFYFATDALALYYDNGTQWYAFGVDYQGTLSARPAAAVLGRIYYATDTTLFYWDTGSAWVTISSPVPTVPIGALMASWAMFQ
jgi:hypothetical protein